MYVLIFDYILWLWAIWGLAPCRSLNIFSLVRFVFLTVMVGSSFYRSVWCILIVGTYTPDWNTYPDWLKHNLTPLVTSLCFSQNYFFCCYFCSSAVFTVCHRTSVAGFSDITSILTTLYDLYYWWIQSFCACFGLVNFIGENFPV